MFGHRATGYLPRAPFPIPECVRVRMERLHPAVKIVWDGKKQQFAMICQERDGLWSVIGGCSFDPPVTLAKTVYRLNQARLPAQMTKQDKENWLHDLDKQQRIDEAAASSAASEMIEEGSDRLLHTLSSKILIPKPNGNPTQRQAARRRTARASKRSR